MNRCPKIGDKVEYPGGPVVGPCTGIVTDIYKKYRYPEDFDWDSDETPRPIGELPERDWHVSLRVDKKPSKWVYGDSDFFAPDVKSLKAIS